MSAFTAELVNYHFYQVGSYVLAEGEIYRDQKRRFHDGAKIHTSAILSYTETDEEIHIVTMKSVYKLSKAHPAGIFRTGFSWDEFLKPLRSLG